MKVNSYGDAFPDQKGLLKKVKSSSFSQIFGKTNLRYFEINFKSKFFGYKLNQTDRMFKSTHKFSEIVDFNTNLTPADFAKSDGWKFGFKAKTVDKEYVLFASGEKEFKQWEFAFNIILKRIPEAFPQISELAFHTALNIFYYPYLKGIDRSAEEKKRKLEEEKRRLEEERRRRQREEEERRRLQLEEEERLRREELEREKEEQDRLRRLMEQEEERLRKLRELQDQQKPKRKHDLIYDEDHQNIFMEAAVKPEQVHQPFERTATLVPEAFLNEELIKKKTNSNLFVKERDIYDWNYYDENLQPVDEKNLINFNPVLAKQNKKLGTAFHSVIKGYMDPQISKSKLNLESMHLQSSEIDVKKENSLKQEVKKLFIPQKENENLQVRSTSNPPLKSFSLLNSIVSQSKVDFGDENVNMNSKRALLEDKNNTSIIRENTIRLQDLDSSIVKKESLVNSLIVNSKSNIRKKDSLIDVNIANNNSINFTIKDSTILKNPKETTTIYDKYFQRKNTLYKNQNKSVIVESNQEEKLTEDLKKSVKLNDPETKERKKKILEKIFFGEEKVENIPTKIEAINANNHQQNEKKITQDTQATHAKFNPIKPVPAKRLTLADPTAFNTNDLFDFDMEDENFTDYKKSHNINNDNAVPQKNQINIKGKLNIGVEGPQMPVNNPHKIPVANEKPSSKNALQSQNTIVNRSEINNSSFKFDSEFDF